MYPSGKLFLKMISNHCTQGFLSKLAVDYTNNTVYLSSDYDGVFPRGTTIYHRYYGDSAPSLWLPSTPGYSLNGGTRRDSFRPVEDFILLWPELAKTPTELLTHVPYVPSWWDRNEDWLHKNTIPLLLCFAALTVPLSISYTVLARHLKSDKVVTASSITSDTVDVIEREVVLGCATACTRACIQKTESP